MMERCLRGNRPPCVAIDALSESGSLIAGTLRESILKDQSLNCRIPRKSRKNHSHCTEIVRCSFHAHETRLVLFGEIQGSMFVVCFSAMKCGSVGACPLWSRNKWPLKAFDANQTASMAFNH